MEGFDLFKNIVWSVLSAEPSLMIGIVLMIIGLYMTAFILKVLKVRKLKKSGMLEVDQMTGRTFEEYLQMLLKSKGYYTRLTPAAGDYGADLILATKSRKIVVQAKRYKKNVGVKAVQEVVSAKAHYQADECWVITNSYFTEQAKRLAGSNKVRLIDRQELMEWMTKRKRESAM